MITRPAVAPAYKGIADYDDDELDILRDTQAVSSDNVSGSELNFFPRSAAGSEADANYTRNPLPGDRPYDVIGIGFEFTFPFLEESATTTDIDLEAFLGDLSHAAVLLRTDQRREELINKHFQELCQWDKLEYNLTGDATNQGFIKRAKLPSGSPIRIDDPIHISTQEVFELIVRFKSTTNFPSDTNWGNLSQGGILGLIAKVQVAYRE